MLDAVGIFHLEVVGLVRDALRRMLVDRTEHIYRHLTIAVEYFHDVANLLSEHGFRRDAGQSLGRLVEKDYLATHVDRNDRARDAGEYDLELVALRRNHALFAPERGKGAAQGLGGRVEAVGEVLYLIARLDVGTIAEIA